MRFSHTFVGRLAGLIFILAGCSRFIVGQTSPAVPAQQLESSDPTLTHRPPPKAKNLLIPEGKIKLDVMVNDSAGQPLPGLQPWDFKILDNNQPRKVLSFRAFNDSEAKPDPPVEVILVIDMVNLPFQEVAVTRQEIERFLQANGGHLRQPVTLLLLTDAGMRVQPRPSVDGNALVSVVRQIKGNVRTVDAAMAGEGLLERFQLCARQMEAIAENEARKPGRKMLIWVGPGWPMLTRPELGYYSEKDQRRYFDGIVELSTRLREARMVVYSVAPTTDADTTHAIRYQDYLKPVKSPRESDPGDLSLKVLATQTGGKILGPDNDLASQIERCIADANNFYRISFDPPAAEHADEYHDLKVTVDKLGVVVRTNSGYYNEPAGH
ncbi:MAG: VWA domain-containing protein [Terracidiphilus sp.]